MNMYKFYFNDIPPMMVTYETMRRVMEAEEGYMDIRVVEVKEEE